MAKKEKYYFKQWCIDNDRYDILDRWDYEKTGFGPEDITFSSAKDVYFKCPKGLHESEPKKVHRITSKSSDQHNFVCNECNNYKNHSLQDLTGNRYGDLIVIKLDEERSNKLKGTYWICECSCGNTKSVAAPHLKNGSVVTCGDRKIHRSGSNNSNWKGGITPELLSKRTSQEYKEWRNAVYAKDWYTCQCCGAYGDNIEKNAHHIKNFSEYPEFEYDIDNGICLCAECHHIKSKNSFHNIYGTTHNTPEQLEEYINEKRKQLGIDIPFSIDEYVSGNNKLVPTNNFNKYIVINQENRLCSISIPLLDAELIWSQNTKEE